MDAKKVLVIGCGFSSGSYGTKLSNKLGEMPTDELVSTQGWYDHLGVLQERAIDVYSMPNLGWLAYAHLLRGLRDSGTLVQYDLLIVQETYEPRFYIVGGQFSSEFVQSPRLPEGERKPTLQHWTYRGAPASLVMTCDGAVSFYKDFVSRNIDAHRVPQLVADKVLADIAQSEYVRTLLLSSQRLAMDMTREAGIKTIVVSFFDPSMPCVDNLNDGPVRIMSDVYNGICLPNRNEYLTHPSKGPGSLAGRLTRDGNAKLGQLINDKIGAAL